MLLWMLLRCRVFEFGRIKPLVAPEGAVEFQLTD